MPPGIMFWCDYCKGWFDRHHFYQRPDRNCPRGECRKRIRHRKQERKKRIAGS